MHIFKSFGHIYSWKCLWMQFGNMATTCSFNTLKGLDSRKLIMSSKGIRSWGVNCNRAHKVSHEWLATLWGCNRTNNRNNAPSPKTITAATMIEQKQLMTAATLLQLRGDQYSGLIPLMDPQSTLHQHLENVHQKARLWVYFNWF